MMLTKSVYSEAHLVVNIRNASGVLNCCQPEQSYCVKDSRLGKIDSYAMLLKWKAVKYLTGHLIFMHDHKAYKNMPLSGASISIYFMRTS